MQAHWSPTVEEAVNSFLTDRKANSCTPRTLEPYYSRLGSFSRFLTLSFPRSLLICWVPFGFSCMPTMLLSLKPIYHHYLFNTTRIYR